MSDSVQATIKDIEWMAGAWRGALGPQTVQEEWRLLPGGILSTMATLSTDTEVNMIELIAIGEENGSLALHLRQHSPTLEVRYTDDLHLQACDAQSVRFRSPNADAHIKELEYRLLPDQSLQVELTMGPDAVLVALLQRP
ncbi:MAG: DUF6265 family protein [Pseudomonadales bacterium]